MNNDEIDGISIKIYFNKSTTNEIPNSNPKENSNTDEINGLFSCKQNGFVMQKDLP